MHRKCYNVITSDEIKVISARIVIIYLSLHDLSDPFPIGMPKIKPSLRAGWMLFSEELWFWEVVFLSSC